MTKQWIDNRPKCSKCNTAPADVIEYDYLLSCAKCWNEKNIPADWRKAYKRGAFDYANKTC